MPQKTDHELFHDALAMWERPTSPAAAHKFGHTVLADVDTDAFIDRVLSLPSAGVLID